MSWMRRTIHKIMRAVDRLILLLLTFPPLYFAYRFIRWYVNTEPVEEEGTQSSDGTKDSEY